MQKIVVILAILVVLIFGVFLFFKSSNKSENNQTGLANPASVYCIDQGGKLDIVTEVSGGGQIGICNFPDGRSCEEWDFFRSKVCTSTTSTKQK